VEEGKSAIGAPPW